MGQPSRRGRSKLSYSERRKSWPFSVLESPNRSYIPRLVIVGLGRSVGELPVRFLVTWPVGRCVKNQPHDNIDPRRCHCVPWHGGLPPMEAASSLGAGERRSPRWLRPPGVQKRAKAAVTELPRSLRAASKSAERSPLLLAALGGLSCQLSARQPRAAPCRACRRGCCARWPQRWSTTGTATVLVLELVHTTTCQAWVSTDVSWSTCIGRGHCLWRPWAGRCCMPRVSVVESVS